MTQGRNLVGVGIGPSNLSLAALLEGIDEVNVRFFERRDRFSWHPGLMFSAARMQTSYLKDLVTSVDPTNRYSFLNYLVQHGRFYPFLARDRSNIGRQEFADYLGWVARALKSLQFGVDIREIRFEAGCFEVVDAKRQITKADHICVGTGRRPRVPDCARGLLGDRCFHAIDIMNRSFDVSGQRVAVVGGGQTGAEVMLELLRQRWGMPLDVNWISRRANFEPLDESPFTNHLFTPGYVRKFHTLDPATRSTLLAQQRLAGDGISYSTLEELHDVIYEGLVGGSGPRIQLRPGCELRDMTPSFRLQLRHHFDQSQESVPADLVILCTGFDDALPSCLEGLCSRLNLENGHLMVGPNFSVDWDGPAGHRIYAVNAGRHSLGIADSQLSLMAWRSASIINDLLGRPHFNTDGLSLIRWGSAPDQAVGKPAVRREI